MVTTLADLSVELFYEIFVYFQLHEIWNLFSDVNLRITAIIENLPSISVYSGFIGMNIETSNFYYEYLSQRNICTRLTSLCVCDTFSIDKGLWFAKHGSTFINLRHLSLIDVKRSTFEMILDSLPPIYSLIKFSIDFVSNDDRARCTFEDVPEGAYHERIFRLFPSLRVCHLLFGRYRLYTFNNFYGIQRPETFVPIQSNLLNLKSLTLRYCFTKILSHLFEHLPQLEQLSCYLINISESPQYHSVELDNNEHTLINRRLAPNLRRLKMNWSKDMIDMTSIEMLFDCDVLFSLTHFTLLARLTHLDVLQNVLSKLSSQCIYRFDVTWYIMGDVSLSHTSNILSNTFEQLKVPIPIELQLSLQRNMYSMRAMTLPRMDIFLFIDGYLGGHIVHAQSRWPYGKHNLNNRRFHCNEIRMSDRYNEIDGEFLSWSPNIICWDRITSIYLLHPFNSTHLHVLFSYAINLRTLTLEYIGTLRDSFFSKKQNMIDLINDQSLCNMLMSNGLRQLNLIVDTDHSNFINFAHLIVERLPYLEAIEVHSDGVEVIVMAPILVNGLSKLNFLNFYGCLRINSFYEIAPCYSITRPFRMEIATTGVNHDGLVIWL